jgi:uncharacterized protein (DUF3084 family)
MKKYPSKQNEKDNLDALVFNKREELKAVKKEKEEYLKSFKEKMDNDMSILKDERDKFAMESKRIKDEYKKLQDREKKATAVDKDLAAREKRIDILNRQIASKNELLNIKERNLGDSQKSISKSLDGVNKAVEQLIVDRKRYNSNLLKMKASYSKIDTDRKRIEDVRELQKKQQLKIAEMEISSNNRVKAINIEARAIDNSHKEYEKKNKELSMREDAVVKKLAEIRDGEERIKSRKYELGNLEKRLKMQMGIKKLKEEGIL